MLSVPDRNLEVTACARCCFLAIGLLAGDSVWAAAAAPLTSIGAVKSLSPEQAAGKLPVRLRGVVTYVRPVERNLYLQDDSGGVQLLPSDLLGSLAIGDGIEVEGVTDPGSFRPAVQPARIRRLGRAELPAAPPVTTLMMIDPRWEGRRVAIEGLVINRGMFQDATWLNVLLPDGVIHAFLSGWTPEQLPADLIGARIRLNGTCAPMASADRRVTLAFLFAPPQADILIPAAPRVDLAAFAVTPAQRLRHREATASEPPPTFLEGEVTAILSTRAFYLQDASAGILIRSVLPVDVRLGSRLRALGYPRREGAGVVFDLGEQREVARGELPPPVPLTPEMLVRGEHEQRRTCFEARLLSVTRSAASKQLDLTLQFGSVVVIAQVPPHLVDAQTLIVGSRVRVCGVLEERASPDGDPQGLHVYLARGDDLVVVAGPPPDPTRLLLGTIAALGAVAALAVAWNLTLRRQVRARTAELGASQQRLQATLEALPDLMFRLNFEGRLLECHPVAGDCFYVSPPLFLGKKLTEILPADAADAIMAALAEAAVHGQHQGTTYSLVLPQGRAWFELSIATMREPKQAEPQFIALARDVTQRKQSEETLRELNCQLEQRTAELVADISRRQQVEAALRESEERFRLAFNHANTGMCVVDLQGRIVQANDKMAEIFGYSRNELERMTVEELAVPEDVGRSREFMQRAILGSRESVTFEKRYYHQQGRIIYGEVASSLVRDGQGRPLYFISQVQDITERKQAERQLHEANERLEQRVAERTAELTRAMQGLQAEMEQRRQTEEELRQAKESAESASRAKTQFLANMSHELRTPLTAILGYGELLELDPSPDERQSYLAVIQRNGQALLQLINDVLDLSRVEAGKLALERRDCDPRAIVAEVLNLVQLRAEEKHLSLAAQYIEPLPATLVTDPVRLRQILVNLVGNAVKFTEVGRVQVSVSLAPGPPPQICFAVQDTGIGIAPETVEKIFLPFTQADASNTRRYGGSGLGLTISRRLADLIGGRITVSSQLGQGSTFTLTLPLEMPDQATPCGADVAPGIPPTRDLLPAGGRPHGRILLAEDAADTREFLRLTLSSAGLEVDAVDSGLAACRQALASAAEARPYDLILMDVQMPELNGLDATERLRKLDWARPIVALTAHAMAGDRERCLAAGCDGYLTKPIAQQDLLATLARYLPSRETAQATGSLPPVLRGIGNVEPRAG